MIGRRLFLVMNHGFNYSTVKEGPTYVRRKKGEEYSANCIIIVKHGGGFIMVWGCFAAEGVKGQARITTSMNSELYQRTLQQHFLPMVAQSPCILQQDNAKPHTSRSTQRWFANQGIEVLDWLSQFPDLNPIENLWNFISR